MLRRAIFFAAMWMEKEQQKQQNFLIYFDMMPLMLPTLAHFRHRRAATVAAALAALGHATYPSPQRGRPLLLFHLPFVILADLLFFVRFTLRCVAST